MRSRQGWKQAARAATKTSITEQMWHTGGSHAGSADDIYSGTGNTDQLSVKDSGKGDSDFNDSDSDISGDGGKKNFLTFQPRQREFPAHFPGFFFFVISDS